MQFRAIVKEKLPLATGTSRSGHTWSKATLIVETIETYPRKVALTNMADAVKFLTIPVGTRVMFNITLESREYNGRWYSEIAAWGWEVEESWEATE